MKNCVVAKEFFHQLRNRDERQGEGKHTAIEFRDAFLSYLLHDNTWNASAEGITFDFSDVEVIGPSFANEAFAFFTKYTKPDEVYKKIKFENINPIDKEIIEWEVANGYKE